MSTHGIALDAVDLKSMAFTTDEVMHENEPVILLHGLLGQKRNFASLGNALTKQLQKKRQIFAVDLRNHGDNHDDWRNEMSYSDMADDVLAFLDKQSIDKAILCGHSMGGKNIFLCFMFLDLYKKEMLLLLNL